MEKVLVISTHWVSVRWARSLHGLAAGHLPISVSTASPAVSYPTVCVNTLSLFLKWMEPKNLVKYGVLQFLGLPCPFYPVKLSVPEGDLCPAVHRTVRCFLKSCVTTTPLSSERWLKT